MTGADRVSIPAQGQSLELGEKKVSDLISPETKIQWDGTDGVVIGTLKKLDEWTEWGAPDGGHFFPVELDSQYEGMEITVEGVSTPEKTAAERLWILQADEAHTQRKKFTFKAEGEEIFTLDLSQAELSA